MRGKKYETYSLSVVTNFLNSKNIPFDYSNSKIGLFMPNHGCMINLCNNLYKMSIQTHPSVSGCSFAETAILDNEGKFVLDKFNYNGDVIRHSTPEDLFKHIMECINEFNNTI